MTKKLFGVYFMFFVVGIFGQDKPKEFRSKKVMVKNDTISIDTLSINSSKFKVFNHKNKLISEDNYQVDFGQAQLIIDKNEYPEITIEYYRYPEFLTKIYSPLDKRLIVENTKNTGKLYSATTNKQKSEVKLLDGLSPKGFISRGVTVGNNQNAVTNASLDLSLTGKLSEDVSLRANIFDTNFPLQQSGYSQNITDFDRVFIEMFSKNWKVTGGDLSLNHTENGFLLFDKQVSGIQIDANINKNTSFLASGALVNGEFSVYTLVGSEGNQGPYKIFGPNNQSAIIMVSGSDKVFVNGVLLERGEAKDYVIDYNLGEITFNTSFPINNDMRIRIEFQFSENNYNRFITYDGIKYQYNNLSIAGYFYNESDAKNQPIQQNLSTAQQEILANAGNDTAKMVSESAFEDVFSESRIQYTKATVNGTEIFVYTPEEVDDLFTVTFTNVGANQGSYAIQETIAIGTIYNYVGENLGDYEPVSLLVAPEKLQVIAANVGYQISEKSKLSSEVAFSNYDSNLFSVIDDNKNITVASNLNWEQVFLDKKWQIATNSYYNFIQENFRTVQRFRTVEFNRDWNLTNTTGDQSQMGSFVSFKNKNLGYLNYGFEHLNFSNNFNGNKHSLVSELKTNSTSFNNNISLLTSTSATNRGQFFRLQSTLEHSFGKPYAGALVTIESNDLRHNITNTFETTNHRFKEYESYLVVGDSTNLYTKFGLNYRENDSIVSNRFTQINNRKTFYMDSKLIANKRTNLSIYANYRITDNRFEEDQKTLNSRLIYNQRFFDNFLLFNSTYESASGNLAQQDFVYVETETGQGFYTWIDYNNDGDQDFDEFEIAQYQDQANYLRVPLPNLTYLRTQKASLKQSLTLNPYKWSKKSGLKKALGRFYNQTHLSIQNEQENIGNQFFINPFDFKDEDLLALNYNFRNNLYFNKGLQKYSLTYTYGKTDNKQQFGIGNQIGSSRIHQLKLDQKLAKFWLFDLKLSTANNLLETQNLVNRNYAIDIYEVLPKLTFLYHKDHRLSFIYHLKTKENKTESFEKLTHQKVGMDYFYLTKKKNQITANFNMLFNDFAGALNTPTSYQMLEGLDSGRNFTWTVLWNQRLSKLLNLNLSYFGRKTETSNVIHTGTIEIKAIF